MFNQELSVKINQLHKEKKTYNMRQPYIKIHQLHKNPYIKVFICKP
jgi:hypothetical protein